MAFEYSAKAFIKVYRKFLNWEWYEDVNTKTLFLHCLLKANWKSGTWHGVNYEAGEFITSLQTLAAETNLTIKQIRGSLDKLKRTNELSDRRQGNYRIITVNNWNAYQSEGKPKGRLRANLEEKSGQTKGNSIRIYKNNKEIEEVKEEPAAPLADPEYDWFEELEDDRDKE
jgi:hypothetical protein